MNLTAGAARPGAARAGTFGVFAVVEAGQPGGAVYRDILAKRRIHPRRLGTMQYGLPAARNSGAGLPGVYD
jgi:hypothetical protein